MAETKGNTVTKRLKGHFTKGSAVTTIYRNTTMRQRMLSAINRALSEVESLDTLSCRGIISCTGKNA